jgi:hypothetical protein
MVLGIKGAFKVVAYLLLPHFEKWTTPGFRVVKEKEEVKKEVEKEKWQIRVDEKEKSSDSASRSHGDNESNSGSGSEGEEEKGQKTNKVISKKNSAENIDKKSNSRRKRGSIFAYSPSRKGQRVKVKTKGFVKGKGSKASKMKTVLARRTIHKPKKSAKKRCIEAFLSIMQSQFKEKEKFALKFMIHSVVDMSTNWAVLTLVLTNQAILKKLGVAKHDFEKPFIAKLAK